MRSDIGGPLVTQRRTDWATKFRLAQLSTKVDRVYPSEARVIVRGKQHKAMADQLTTVSKTRLDNRVGRLSQEDLKAVEQAIRIQLGLTP